jgi:hypothetical protein
MIAGQPFTITQTGNTATRDQRFVELLYFSFFGRLPAREERDFQVTEGLKPPATWADLAMRFLNSGEFNSGGRFVAGLYVGLLDRDAEYGGWLFQRNALATNITTQDSVVANFLESDEYRLTFGNPANSEFVRQLYKFILLREASQSEVDFHVRNLTAGQTRVGLARNFLNSQEFRNGTGPRLTAFLLYATLLARDGSLTEIALKRSQLESGTPVASLVDELLKSAEFQDDILR